MLAMDSRSIELMEEEVIHLLSALAEETPKKEVVSSGPSSPLVVGVVQSRKTSHAMWRAHREADRAAQIPVKTLKRPIHTFQHFHEQRNLKKVVPFPKSGWPTTIQGSSSYLSLVKGPIRGKSSQSDLTSRVCECKSEVSGVHNV